MLGTCWPIILTQFSFLLFTSISTPFIGRLGQNHLYAFGKMSYFPASLLNVTPIVMTVTGQYQIQIRSIIIYSYSSRGSACPACLAGNQSINQSISNQWLLITHHWTFSARLSFSLCFRFGQYNSECCRGMCVDRPIYRFWNPVVAGIREEKPQGQIWSCWRLYSVSSKIISAPTFDENHTYRKTAQALNPRDLPSYRDERMLLKSSFCICALRQD